MRRIPIAIEDGVFRAGAGAVGGVLLVSSKFVADLAREHMVLLGAICGAGPAPHCGWCYAAAGLFLTGLFAFAVALAPRRPIASSDLRP